MMTNEEGEAIRKLLRDAPSGTVIQGATIVDNGIPTIEDAILVLEEYREYVDRFNREMTPDEADLAPLLGGDGLMSYTESVPQFLAAHMQFFPSFSQ